jgi:hypothetical protein
MLYIGHFSFDELDYRHKTRHGYLSCVVDAEDEDDAAVQFKRHLIKMKQKNIAFSTIVKVYIEDIIAIAEVPNEPIITRLQSSRGEFPKSISYSLPEAEADGIEAYGLADNVEQHEGEPSADYVESKPFIAF